MQQHTGVQLQMFAACSSSVSSMPSAKPCPSQSLKQHTVRTAVSPLLLLFTWSAITPLSLTRNSTSWRGGQSLRT